MRAAIGIQFIVWLVIVAMGGGVVSGVGHANPPVGLLIFVASFVVASLVASSVRLAAEWERAIILRLGKFQGQRGPGLFFITPIVDTVPYLIDLRTITTVFQAEQTMTHDTVPVDVDAVLFWRVVEPRKAALQVAEYQQAVIWAAQTALRDIIGRSTLAELLSNRERTRRSSTRTTRRRCTCER